MHFCKVIINNFLQNVWIYCICNYLHVLLTSVFIFNAVHCEFYSIRILFCSLESCPIEIMLNCMKLTNGVPMEQSYQSADNTFVLLQWCSSPSYLVRMPPICTFTKTAVVITETIHAA